MNKFKNIINLENYNKSKTKFALEMSNDNVNEGIEIENGSVNECINEENESTNQSVNESEYESDDVLSNMSEDNNYYDHTLKELPITKNPNNLSITCSNCQSMC
jgi:hypothetical protein